MCKKIIAVIGVLALSMNLSACCCLLAPFQMVQEKSVQRVEVPMQPTEDPYENETWPVFEEPDVEITEAPEAPHLTLEDFMEVLNGIWIFEDSVFHMYDDQYCCEVMSISPDFVGTAVYPGGGDRPGRITEHQVLNENTIWLGLTYEAGEFMGDYLEEAHGDITVTVVNEERIDVMYGQGTTYILYYGGQDFDEVNETCRMMGN